MLSKLSFLTLVLIAAGFLGHLWFPLDLVGHFRLHLTAMAMVLLALSWRGGRSPAAFAAASALGLGVLGLGPVFDTPAREAETNGVETRELSILVANVYQFNERTDEVAAAILAADADIVAVIETPEAFATPDGPLNGAYPHRRFTAEDSGIKLGPSLFSRLPMVENYQGNQRGWNPNHLRHAVDIGGVRPLQIFALHFAWPVLMPQERQLQDFRRFGRGMAAPTIVLGDFNAAPWSYAVSRVERLTDTRLVGGLRTTWTAIEGYFAAAVPAPLGLPIDHVLASDCIAVHEVRMIDLPGSDHRGVLARVSVPLDPAPCKPPER